MFFVLFYFWREKEKRKYTCFYVWDSVLYSCLLNSKLLFHLKRYLYSGSVLFLLGRDSFVNTCTRTRVRIYFNFHIAWGEKWCRKSYTLKKVLFFQLIISRSVFLCACATCVSITLTLLWWSLFFLSWWENVNTRNMNNAGFSFFLSFFNLLHFLMLSNNPVPKNCVCVCVTRSGRHRQLWNLRNLGMLKMRKRTRIKYISRAFSYLY